MSVRRDDGQSTVEFLMTFFFVLGILFLFLKVSINITNGYLVHYATFMASRTYLVIDNDSNTPNGSDGMALSRAQAVFDSFNIGQFITNFNGKLNVNDPTYGGNESYIGLFTNYQDTFSLSKILGGGQPITFTSESFLGRDPTRSECVQQVCRSMNDIGGNCSLHSTIVDNGC